MARRLGCSPALLARAAVLSAALGLTWRTLSMCNVPISMHEDDIDYSRGARGAAPGDDPKVEAGCPAMDVYCRSDYNALNTNKEHLEPALMAMGTSLGASKLNIRNESLRAYINASLELMPQNPYHNRGHVFDVTQFAYTMLWRTRVVHALEPTTLFATFLAALSHDLEHTGTSNQILVAEGHRYVSEMAGGIGPLESHHANVASRLLRRHRVLSSLSNAEAESVRLTVRELIHATDIGVHGRVMSDFKDAHGDWENFDSVAFFRSRDNVSKMLAVMMKVADVSHNARPTFEVLRQWRMRIYQEFYAEGDRDRAAGRPLEPLHDRETNDIIKSTGVFIQNYVGTTVDVLSEFLDHCSGAGVQPNALGWVRDPLGKNYVRLKKIDLGTTIQIRIPLVLLSLGTAFCLFSNVRSLPTSRRGSFREYLRGLFGGADVYPVGRAPKPSLSAPSSISRKDLSGTLSRTGSASNMAHYPKEIPLRGLDGPGSGGGDCSDCVGVAGMMLVFGALSSGLIFCSKIVLSTTIVSDELDFHGIRAPFLFGALHQFMVFICFIVWAVFCRLTGSEHGPSFVRSSRQLLVIALFALSHALNVGLNNFSISVLPISLNLVIRSCYPLATFLADVIYRWCDPKHDPKTKGYHIGYRERIWGIIAVSCTVLAIVAQMNGGNHRTQPYLGVGMLAAWVSILAGTLNQWISSSIGANREEFREMRSVDVMFYRSLPTALLLMLPSFLAPHHVWPGDPPMTDWEVVCKVLKIRKSVSWLAVVFGLTATTNTIVSKMLEKRLTERKALQASNVVSRGFAGVLSVLYGVESLPGGWWQVLMVVATMGNIISWSNFARHGQGNTTVGGMAPSEYAMEHSKTLNRRRGRRATSILQLDRYLSQQGQL